MPSPSNIPIIDVAAAGGSEQVERLIARLRLDPADLALHRGRLASAAQSVRAILAEVAARGDEAVADVARQFDDSDFAVDQIRITPGEMQAAVKKIEPWLLEAVRRSIAQVREYQSHIMPPLQPETLKRHGVELGLRYTPLDSVGLHVPGGKAAYPSTLIMLAVPAQVAGVRRIVACTPPSRFGRDDLLLATFHELGITEAFRAGGAAAVGAMAFGTATIPQVDKIVGPGNVYVQLAKRMLAGAVGIDGYLGPSEIVVIADDSARAEYIAADMIAQAEHDPGSSFLLTDSFDLAVRVSSELASRALERGRRDAIETALRESCAIVVASTLGGAIELANRFAAEHVSIQTRDDAAVVGALRHAGAIFTGPYSPVAAGDYLAGPSHCLPTNTTARFTSGVSVFEFLRRTSVERYTRAGLMADAPAIIELANAEHLDGHAASVEVRLREITGS